MVLLDGKVVTLDDKETVAEALAAKFGRILAMGPTKEMESLVGPHTSIVDLRGRTVIPGLIDSHCHPTSAALHHALAVDVSYESGVRSLVDIFARIAEQTKRRPKGEWINAVNEDESKLVERRHPNKWDLDKVAPDHPVMVTTVGGHFSIVNSKAFEIAGVTKDSPDPMGGRFERDPTFEEAMEAIRWVTTQYAASGLTCVNDGGIARPIILRALQELVRRGELPIRMRMDLSCELMPQLTGLGIAEGFGNDMLKICAVKVVADGAISARTAAVAEPYLHRPNYYGELAITKEALRDIVMEGYSKGYRFAVHANGERAIGMFLDVIEEAQEKYPRSDPRNRAIHCTVVTTEIVKRIRKLGVVPTIFGPYPYYHGDKILPAFGAERLERMFAARSFLDAGIKVSAHSDHHASPYPPLMGIHALVNRRTAKGQPIGQSQRISVMEALRLYTINAAHHSFEEDVMGSIEPGKYADMVVLGGDILTVPTETIIDIPVDMTIVGGRIVHQRDAG